MVSCLLVGHLELGQLIGKLNFSVSKLSSFVDRLPLKSQLASPLLGIFVRKLSNLLLCGHFSDKSSIFSVSWPVC